MALLRGCQEGKATPKLMEIECPKCKDIVEVFVSLGTGTIISDEKCEKCGYIIEAEKSVSEFEEA